MREQARDTDLFSYLKKKQKIKRHLAKKLLELRCLSKSFNFVILLVQLEAEKAEQEKSEEKTEEENKEEQKEESMDTDEKKVSKLFFFH